MTDNNRIRKGSLQFYPRVRAKKVIPSVNWAPVKKDGNTLKGFIGYKAAMISVWAKDETPDSLTKGKRIAVPATVIECPPMKIYSIRLYKDNKLIKDILVTNDKDLRKKLKLSKKEITKELGEIKEDYDDVRVVLYSLVKLTSVDKKKPDMLEFALSGSLEEKLNFIKEKISKEISVNEVFQDGIADIRGVTRGFGTQGPVKRFGIALKDHKSEKGVRRPGSLAPWHPARTTFRAPQAGQTGYQNRISYNNLIMEVGKIKDKNINKSGGFDHYGIIKTDYIIIRGSIPGPKKRGLVITPSIKPSKKQIKKKFEILELR